MRAPSFNGEVVIADASAIHRARHPMVREEVAAAFNARQIATCTVVRLELMHAARDLEEIEDLQAVHASLRKIPISDSVQHAAMGAVRELAKRGAGRHRVPVPDVLIAAAAQEAGVGVLHYDRDFDRLAEVLYFRSIWLAPAGSL